MGIGDALDDVTARVGADFLLRFGHDRNGRVGASAEEQAAILAEVGASACDVVRTHGGATANALRLLNALGMNCAFLGGVGDDPEGDAWRADFTASGGDASRFKIRRGAPTGTCLCLVSPDAQRTFLTCPGAAALTPDDIREEDFDGVDFLYSEGYLLLNPGVAERVLSIVKERGIRVAMDLGAFQCVRSHKPLLRKFLTECVELVFANEEEAAAFADPDSETPESGLFALADLCETAVVTRGAKGAMIRSGARSFCVSAPRVNAVDANGAGDVWHGAYLYGYLRGCDPGVCGRFGSLAAAEVVQVPGTSVPPERIAALKERFDALERMNATRKSQ